MANSESEDFDLLMTKVTALLLLFFITICMAAVPFTLNKCFKWTTENRSNPRSTQTMQCLLHFGGGVLLCITFVYFLPEVEEICDKLIVCGILPPLNFPLPTTLMCAGFILMFFIEECVHAFFHPQKTENNENSIEPRSSTVTLAVEFSTENIVSEFQRAQSTNQIHHSHMPSNVDLEEATITASVRGALLVFALSIHEIFEGLTIGLENTTISVWFLVVAISVHKLILAFCLGMELLVSRIKPLLSFIYLLIYALVTPMGVVIGLAITENSNEIIEPNLISAILQGIACGTLVYVVFFEIISTKHMGFLTFFSLLIGFCLMLAMLHFGEHNDDATNVNCQAQNIAASADAAILSLATLNAIE